MIYPRKPRVPDDSRIFEYTAVNPNSMNMTPKNATDVTHSQFGFSTTATTFWLRLFTGRNNEKQIE